MVAPTRESYPDNSNNRKKKDKVVKGSVHKREKPVSRKIAENFVSDDAQTVGGYILFDVMIPALKSMISDMISEGTDRFLFGSGRSGRRSVRSASGRASYTSYNTIGASRASEPARPVREVHKFDEIIFETRGDAEVVLERMSDQIADYGLVTVSDLYDFCGMTGDYTDDRWGWAESRGFSIGRARGGGFFLDLPKPSAIN